MPPPTPPADIDDMFDMSPPPDIPMEPPPSDADMFDPMAPIDVPNGLPNGLVPVAVPIDGAPGAFRFLEGEDLDCD